ncbi:MAG: MFS transporter [Candidatus Riflebacteria bacterium]|nr:MFS transporter [Candidatus Riflebacteria bacterium]
MGLAILQERRDFRLLWMAQLITFIGDGIFTTAMLWWLIQKTGSGTIVGFIMSVSFLPAILIGPFAGTLADRLPAKVLLIGADLFRAVLIVFFAWLAQQDALAVKHLFVLCGLLATAGVFHSPTTLTVIPRVVPPDRLDEAMALHTIVRDISKLVGPSIGGLIIARWSVVEAFASHAGCLVFSACCVGLMTIGEREGGETREGVFEQLWAGLRYVRSQSVLLQVLVGFGALNLFVVPIIVLLPLSVAKVFHLGSFELGLSEGALAFGSVVTGLLFPQMFGEVRTSVLLVRIVGFSGLLFLLFAVNPVFGLFLAMLFLLGGCFTGVNVAVLTLFQRAVAPEMKGRFFALVEVVCYALFPIALAGAGSLSDAIGVPWCYGICGVGTLVLTWRFARIRGLSSIDAAEGG